MADTPPAASTASKGSTFGFLGKKVFGKVPVWVIAVAAVGGYYWYTRRKKAGTGMQTDPAGNTCTAINPATGYCPGTPEDAAAIAAASGADTGGTSGTVDTGGGAAGTSGAGGAGGAGTDGGAPASGTTPQPDTTGATPPPVVIPAAPPPPAHANAHAAHVAHEQHLAEERTDRAQAAHAAHVAHTAHLAHLKKKGARK